MAQRPEITTHETTHVDVRPIVITGLALALTAGVVLAISVGLFHYFVANAPQIQAPPNPMAQENQQFPPAPRIEEHPATEVEELHRQEDRILSSYGWADKKAGKVRIPIDRAIDLQLQRGFPLRKEAPKQ